MKLFFVLVSLLLADSLFAQQLHVRNGTYLKTSGANITVRNMGLQSNGIFNNHQSSLFITGNDSFAFSLPGTLELVHLSVDKGTGVANFNAGHLKVNSLQLESGTLDFGNAHLQIAGPITGAGYLRGSAQSYLSISDSAGGFLRFQSSVDSLCSVGLLKVSGGNVSLASKLNVFSKVDVAAGTLNLSNSNLVLKACRDSSAYIAPIAGSLLNSTNVTVERFVDSGRRAYRLFGHPFNSSIGLSQVTDNIDITGQGGASNGFTPTQTNNPSAFWYDGSSNNWVAFTSANANTLANYWKPYQGIRVMVRGQKGQGLSSNNYFPLATVVDANGSITKGSITIPLQKGTQGWNLVGNPYPAPLQMEGLFDAENNPKLVGSSFYVVNPYHQDQGNYQQVLFGTNYTLPMFGAFFVQVNADTSLSVNENNKCVSTSGHHLKGSALTSYTHVKMNKGNSTWDELYVLHNAAASDSLDRRDTRKMFNPQGDLYSLSADGGYLAADCRPISATTQLLLGVRTAVPGIYTLSFEKLGFPEDLIPLLIDNFLGTLTPITEGDSYAFEMNSHAGTQGQDRFAIIFQLKTVLGVNSIALDASVKGTSAVLKWGVNGVGNLDYFEVQRSKDGISFTKLGTVGTHADNAYLFTDEFPGSGRIYYRIKAVAANGGIVYSNVSALNIYANPQISIYPNPVKERLINLRLSNVPEGKLQLALYNNLGQQVYSETMMHDGSPANYKFVLHPGMVAGVYKLSVSGILNKQFNVVVE